MAYHVTKDLKAEVKVSGSLFFERSFNSCLISDHHVVFYRRTRCGYVENSIYHI